MLAEFRVSHLEIRHFRLKWNDISYWETRKYRYGRTSFRAHWNAALSVQESRTQTLANDKDGGCSGVSDCQPASVSAMSGNCLLCAVS